jgi:hypothetical protein
MKKILILSLSVFIFSGVFAQKYMSRNAYVGFYSHTPIEDIKADNNQVAAILDAATGEFVFQLLVKSFSFDKALMQEHFNENYMESEIHPKSTFKGKVVNFSEVNFSKPGKYPVQVEGELMIHGVSKHINTSGTFDIGSDNVKADAVFEIKPEDYNISIPKLVREKIAEKIQVTVSATMTRQP